MKADPFQQRQLLRVQELDTQLAQLEHRAANLPELARLQELQSRRPSEADAEVVARTELSDLDRDIAKLEAEVEQVRARRQRNDERMTAGSVPARELSGMQHEQDSLGRRASSLEDDELELMEARENAEGAATTAAQALAATDADIEQTTARRDEELARIADTREEVAAARGPAASGIDEDLLALYGRLHGRLPTAAALLQARRCGACRLELAGSELAAAAAAPADEVLRCDNCGAIMVRTDESGL